jgi:hypothetical protein
MILKPRRLLLPSNQNLFKDKFNQLIVSQFGFLLFNTEFGLNTVQISVFPTIRCKKEKL